MGAQEQVARVEDGSPAWFRELLLLAMRNSARAEREAEDRLTAARSAGDTASEIHALLALGGARGRQNDMVAAVQHTRLALQLAERLGHALFVITARSHHAGALRGSDDFPGAIELYLQNLRAAEQQGHLSLLRDCFHGLAVSYAGLGDTDRALDFAQRAYSLAEKIGEPNVVGVSATVLAEAHLARTEYAEARRYFSRALEVRERLGNRTDIADSAEAIAMLDFREGRVEEALAALTSIETQRRRLRGRVKLTNTLLHRANLLSSVGRHDEALACAEEARGYADTMSTPGLVAKAYERLSAVREARGDHAGALAAARVSFAAETEVNNESARRRAAELQARYEVAKKDEQVARLTRDKEVYMAESRAHSAQLAQNAAELRAAAVDLSHSRLQRYALVIGIGAATVLLGTVVLMQRARLRAERRALEETRRAQMAAEDADVLKTRLLGIASHDLKGPLRSMLRSADTLERKASDPSAVAENARLLRGHAQQMFDLVRDLLDLAAIEGGSLRLHRSTLDLGRLAAEVVTRHVARAVEKEQTLRFEPSPEGALNTVGDSARLAQAIDNLVDNAIKYTSPGGNIRVTAGRRASEVFVAVADEGPGLGPDDLARMFQPFQRLSALPTGGESSTGLGLHITRDFVARHGGRVDVDSAPSAGTTFTIVLPLASG